MKFLTKNPYDIYGCFQYIVLAKMRVIGDFVEHEKCLPMSRLSQHNAES